MKKIKSYATHFCGIGGACYGLEQLGLECKLAIDYVPFIVEARERNLGHKALCMDISEYEPKPEHKADLLWTSPPCQTFSTSAREHLTRAMNSSDEGEREKIRNDVRNNLFLASHRYTQHFKPRFVVLENVMGLLTHGVTGDDGIGTFVHMQQAFRDLGYFVEWNVLNSKNFGLPQDRDRVFLVAARDKADIVTGIEPIFGLIPRVKSYDPTVFFRDIMQPNTTEGAWGASTYKTAVTKVQRTDVEFTIVEPGDILPTITCGWGGGPTRKKVAVLDCTTDGLYFLRNPTVREGARAQGFPDSWQFPNDTKAWTMIGNAVSSPVAQAIGAHLLAISKGERPPFEERLWNPRIPVSQKRIFNLPPPDMFAQTA
jgi:DNA (cytosine-5)-methyltransferase 1